MPKTLAVEPGMPSFYCSEPLLVPVISTLGMFNLLHSTIHVNTYSCHFSKYLQTNPFGPTNFKPILSARMEEFPWAMLAKGPACTKTGVPCGSNKTTN